MDRLALAQAVVGAPTPPAVEVNDVEKSMPTKVEIHAIDFEKAPPENEKHQASNLLSVILLEFGICEYPLFIVPRG